MLQNLEHHQQTFSRLSAFFPLHREREKERRREDKEDEMAATQTIQVPHLGGIRAGYAISGDGQIDPSKPTCVLINAMCSEQLLNTLFTPLRGRTSLPWPVAPRPCQLSDHETGYGRIMAY